MQRVKYVLHSGYVCSNYDGDTHYISDYALAKLYGLRPYEWVSSKSVYLNQCLSITRDHELKHLYPRYDGNYELKDN